MKQPKIMSETGFRHSLIEIATLFALTTVAASQWLEMHWAVAMASAPVIMLVMLLVVAAAVQLLWMTVLGMEKLGVACGLRKSPLA